MANEEELKLKRKVQLIVITAMSLFFVLVTVVVFQFAIRINQESQKNSLKKQNAALQRQIDNALDETAYYNSKDFIYDFAARFLNRGRPNDIVFF